MKFQDLMDAMSWAAQETDQLRENFVNEFDVATPADDEFEAGHKKFGEALAWLQDNRALFEAAPGLKAENKRILDAIGNLYIAVFPMESPAGKTIDDMRSRIKEWQTDAAINAEMLVSMEWMQEAMRKSAGDAWCAIREQPNAKENMNRFDNAVAKAKAQQDAPDSP